MDDLELRQCLLDELQFQPGIDVRNIGVTVDHGVVTLTGHVSSYREKLMVERAVAAIRGVRGYAEEIEVRFPGIVSTSDDEIARRAADMLHWSTMVPDDQVQVKVQKGWVTLTGMLAWNYQRIGAEEALRNLQGVTGITNLIELMPRLSAIDVRRHIEAALKRNAGIDADRVIVTVHGNKVTLTGNVKAWSERHIAEQAAWSTPGVTHVDDRLTIS